MEEDVSKIYEFLIEKVLSVLELSEYEKNILKRVIYLPYNTISNSKVVLSDKIDECIRSKSELNYIIMRVLDKKKVVQISHDSEYNKYFTILTRQNRPSKQAIDSEIRYTRSDINEKYILLNEYELVLKYLYDLQVVLDLYIKNLENRRYNL